MSRDVIRRRHVCVSSACGLGRGFRLLGKDWHIAAWVRDGTRSAGSWHILNGRRCRSPMIGTLRSKSRGRRGRRELRSGGGRSELCLCSGSQLAYGMCRLRRLRSTRRIGTAVSRQIRLDVEVLSDGWSEGLCETRNDALVLALHSTCGKITSQHALAEGSCMPRRSCVQFSAHRH